MSPGRINTNIYYRWSKEFLEAGKKRLAGDTAREATSDEVKNLRAESSALKETLAELLMENRLLKKWSWAEIFLLLKLGFKKCIYFGTISQISPAFLEISDFRLVAQYDHLVMLSILVLREIRIHLKWKQAY